MAASAQVPDDYATWQRVLESFIQGRSLDDDELAQAQEAAFGFLVEGIAVPFGTADRAEQNSVGRVRPAISLVIVWIGDSATKTTDSAMAMAAPASSATASRHGSRPPREVRCSAKSPPPT